MVLNLKVKICVDGLRTDFWSPQKELNRDEEVLLLFYGAARPDHAFFLFLVVRKRIVNVRFSTFPNRIQKETFLQTSTSSAFSTFLYLGELKN